MKATIIAKDGKLLLEGVTLDPTSTVKEALVKAIHTRYPKYHPSRQRLVLADGVTVLDHHARISSYQQQLQLPINKGGNDTIQIKFKDLGPQVSWTTVFIVEYLGPLIIHPLIYFLPHLFYAEIPHQKSWTQTASFALLMIHFVKREVETLFIHRFSHDTMPVSSLIRNCLYYWFLSGLLLAYPLYAPSFVGGALGGGCQDSTPRWIVMAIWTWAQLSNLYTHVQLRHLRPPGTRERNIPYGYGFTLVSCPNYFFEMVGWMAYTALNGSAFAALFTIVGAVQMASWAIKKHQNYLKDFPDKYPRHRKAMIPFLL